ncbi:MAG TPA: glycosyltransferase family A protein, partial [Gemmatimonadaceae bacterium]|nr:glycosyltransferase family A protein [Gemmatimonadaceae bacterium]
MTRRFEESGWAVNLIPIGDADAVKELLFVVAPITSVVSQVVERWPPERMPPLRRVSEEVSTGPRLLIRLPTRDRPNQALAVVEKYRAMAGCAITIEVIVDFNDLTMLRAEILQRLDALECIVTVGNHQNKIEACNGGEVRDWDILMLASDDMVPVVDGYAVRVIEAMHEHWPHLDGAIFFNDGKQRKELCTLPILGRRLYDQFGFVYAPQYESLFCDREQTELLTAMGRLTYVNEVLIEHRHHVWGRAEIDALYRRNDAREATDRRTYEMRADHRRRDAQWAFGSPPMWLSIGICTLPERQKQLERLLYRLYTQIKWSAPRGVEILVDDRKDVTIGEKRQALLERALGHFIAFIDDDDSVAYNYIFRIIHALKTEPDADCVALNGII